MDPLFLRIPILKEEVIMPAPDEVVETLLDLFAKTAEMAVELAKATGKVVVEVVGGVAEKLGDGK